MSPLPREPMSASLGRQARLGWVLFDLDGTLIDSIGLIIDSYHHTLRALGLPAKDDAYWLAGIGTPLREQFAEWARDTELLQQLVSTYREYNHIHHDHRVTAYPGVLQALTELKSAGVRTAVVTSKMRRGALRGLKLVGLLDLIDVLVGADDVSRPKPHPEPVHKAVTALAAERHRTAFVGDSVHDMDAGRAAGVATAAALWGPFDRATLEGARPTHWLEHPADVVALAHG